MIGPFNIIHRKREVVVYEVQMKIEVKGDLEILRLQPSDVVVLTMDDPITELQYEALRDELKSHFPDHRVLVVSEGTLSVVQREQLC